MQYHMISVGKELERRLTAASPAQRYLRTMPALYGFLTMMAFSFTLSAVYEGKDTFAAWVFGIGSLLWWSELRENVRRARQGQPVKGQLSVFFEWGMGLTLTFLMTIIVCYAVTLSHTHTHLPHHSVLAFLLRLGLKASVLATLISLLYWWMRFIGDLCRPSSATLQG